MMSKWILLSSAALLAVAGCDLGGSLTTGCEEIRNETQSTRGDTITTTTGLRYIELQQGTGIAARSCRPSVVAYVGRLTDGTQFDQGGFEIVPGFGRFIPGFEQGVVGMKVDGRRRLFIPPQLAYGSQSSTNPANGVTIPANATLVFDIELTATQ